jgi:hypothetical protein
MSGSSTSLPKKKDFIGSSSAITIDEKIKTDSAAFRILNVDACCKPRIRGSIGPFGETALNGCFTITI